MKKASKIKMRILRSGRNVPEQKNEFPLTISSKCPDKWLFVDLETGDVWHVRPDAMHNKSSFWRKASFVELKELKLVTRQELRLALKQGVQIEG